MQKILPIYLPIMLVIVSASRAVEIRRRYHQEVGIPLASHIKAIEEATNRHRRSTGGGPASIYYYPFVAGLLIYLEDFDLSVCSASLLNHQHLVSAAHCWYDGEDQSQFYTVVLGSESLFNGGLRIITADVVVHYEWEPSTLLNDIPIITLPHKIRFSDKIFPVALPSKVDLSKTFVGYQAVVIGFGMTSFWDSFDEEKRTASYVKVKIITNRKCSFSYNDIIPRSQMCTSGLGGVGICDGDSGGPLIIRKLRKNILIGISSFAGVASCPRGKPSGFTRVTEFYDFIYDHIS
ncbi:hypothetical protein K1T71_001887 [Dendrolimus kikuchii]|uniref:Uncharacterized protein n=1 Tax=Dendrolimus kikuchii TaxID=765133 RepID=A0ACC1DFT5_9NEOP|nr:hypothetical protein K1T71_001887 [Dendrolimus kikuchii]